MEYWQSDIAIPAWTDKNQSKFVLNCEVNICFVCILLYRLWVSPVTARFLLSDRWRIHKVWKVGAEDNVSPSSLFLANAYNELYAFYTGNGGLLNQ